MLLFFKMKHVIIFENSVQNVKVWHDNELQKCTIQNWSNRIKSYWRPSIEMLCTSYACPETVKWDFKCFQASQTGTSSRSHQTDDSRDKKTEKKRSKHSGRHGSVIKTVTSWNTNKSLSMERILWQRPELREDCLKKSFKKA